MESFSAFGSAAATPGTSDILAWLWNVLPFILGAALVIIIVAIVMRRRKGNDDTPKGPGAGTGTGTGTGTTPSDGPKHSA